MATDVKAEQIEQRIVDVLVGFGAEREAIEPGATFEELDVDSLDLVELAQIVESEYGVKIDQDELPKLTTVGAAVGFVVERAG